MPLFDLQKKLGISVDRHLSIQSAEQPFKIASRCHAFEKEWIECAHGIGSTRAQKECKIELDDLQECLQRMKTIKRVHRIQRQRAKLIEEGKYTPPPHHQGQGEVRP
ncbi:NADH dehydrogenase [ubiquinone] iron-sulfur protein 5 [Perognathus longimembris pacificus]|uniref:NADH dehydrogenase [ubiquinone] iron-sulfur protein 5 n=1 Tax=Perognathus longimembris pacificus TaxID=214514 RepID=UPI0020190D59|nr:NADH dehydrogenase [ubiquinone] iron-sulfur protein 5 [Perognathus longimembris pacificus]